VNTVSELIDNRAHRLSVLKEIIQHLHAGAAPELVKEQLRKIIGETDATEIMAMEQQLMAEGMPIEEVRAMCDLGEPECNRFHCHNLRRQFHCLGQ
jgi:DUF438 domain-containing protein